MNSKIPRQQARWDLVYYVMPIESLPKKLVRVVQFKIHSCFRSAVRPRNPHTPKPKSASMDTVETAVVRVWNGSAERRFFSKSERKFGPETFCKFGVGLRIFIPGRAKRRGNFDLDNFIHREEGSGIGIRIIVAERVKGRKDLNLE